MLGVLPLASLTERAGSEEPMAGAQFFVYSGFHSTKAFNSCISLFPHEAESNVAPTTASVSVNLFKPVPIRCHRVSLCITQLQRSTH